MSELTTTPFSRMKRNILNSQKTLLAIHKEMVDVRGGPDDEAAHICLMKLRVQLERAKRQRGIAVEAYEQASGRVYAPTRAWLSYKRSHLKAGGMVGDPGGDGRLPISSSTSIQSQTTKTSNPMATKSAIQSAQSP